MPVNRKKILFVEDNEDTIEIVTLMLSVDDIDVVSTRTVAEGFELSRNGQFDVFLLDHLLLDGTGIDLCARIRSFDLKTPVFIFSGMDSKTDRSRALAAGAQEYVRKPEDLEFLSPMINRYVES
ncbi:MAG TPA: response regulator [Blastocatellia bacterium]|nr:response regulator [Blastocatellia bacterium]